MRKIKVYTATIVDNESNTVVTLCGRTELQVLKKVWAHVKDDVDELFADDPHSKPNGKNARVSLEIYFDTLAEKAQDIWMSLDADTI